MDELAHHPDLKDIWRATAAKVKSTFVQYISMTLPARTRHTKPHFKPTPLAKSKFLGANDQLLEPSAVRDFLRAADIHLMEAFLPIPPMDRAKEAASMQVSIPLSACSSQVQGVVTVLDEEDRFFMGDACTEEFSYPLLTPRNTSSLNIELVRFKIAALKHMPRTTEILICGHYSEEKFWGADSVEQQNFLTGASVFPHYQPQSNRKPDNTKTIRVLTPGEARMLRIFGHKTLVLLQEAYTDSNLPEHAERLSGWTEMVTRSNHVIKESLRRFGPQV